MANEFVARNGVIAQNNSQITGSLIVSNGITADLTGTASYASNANLLDGLDSTQLVLTSSFNAYTASVNNNSGSFVTYTNFNADTASINAFTASILSYTSSLNSVTSSFVRNSQTSSFVQNSQTSSFATFTALNAYTSSTNNFSASILSYTSSLNLATSSFVRNSQTSSFVQNSQTSSMSVLNAVSSSLAATASTVNIQQASIASNSYAITFVGPSSYTSTQQLFTAGGTPSAFSFDPGTETLTVKNIAGTASFSQTASYARSASQALNAANANTIDVSVFGADFDSYVLLSNAAATSGVAVGSDADLKYNSSTNKLTVGSVSSTSLTGSLLGTASYASNSNLLDGLDSTVFTLNSQTSSFVLNSQTSSMSVLSASFAATSSFANNFTVANTLTAQTLVVQTVSSSVIYSSGSNTFGNSLANNQVLTGSVIITGSLSVNGSNAVLTNQTSSFTLNSQTSSFVQNSQTGAFATFTALNAYTSSTNNFSASILSYTASQNNLNSTFATTSSLNAYTSSLNTYTSSLNSSTGSFATFTALNAYTSSINTYTSSLNSKTSSFATTGSNTFNGNLIITGSVMIGSSSLGPNENTITLGARDTVSEGGQIGFNAPGGTYNSASFIDNWQNFTRILRGTNASSTGLVAQWNLHTLQMELPGYTSATSFVGTAAANLAVDSSGKVITVSTSGGTVFPYTGNAVITGSLTATTGLISPVNGGMYLRGGDDAEFWDINVVNTVGIYGQQNADRAAIKLGSSGPTLFGSASRFGINTITPTQGTLEVNGNIYATSFTGSLLGTATSASNAISASQSANSTLLNGLASSTFALTANTASFATFTAFNFYTGSANAFSASILSYTASQNNLNTTFATTGSNTFVGKQNISGSTYVSGTIRQGVLGGTESILEGYGLVVQGSTAKLRVGPNYSTGGDRDYVDIIADGTNSTLQTNNENFLINNQSSGGNITLRTSGSGNINVTGSVNITGSTNIVGITSIKGPLNVSGSTSIFSGSYGNVSILPNPSSNSPLASINGSTIEDYIFTVYNSGADGSGVLGSSVTQTGVRGDSDSGVGIGSYTNTGIGVDAYSDGSGTALQAFSATGIIAYFGSNGGERMRLTNAGFLGINKSIPSTHLDILGNANITGSLFIAGGNNSISTSIWEKLKLVTAGVTAPARQGSDANGLNFTTNALWNGAWSQDDSTKKSFAYIQHLGNGRHEFRTSPSGGTVSYTTSLTIDESNVNINVPTNITSTTNITGSLNVTGSSRIIGSLGVGIAPSATAGRIDASNDIVAFSTSDIRFKENIKPIPNALNKIDQIGGYTFDWKTEEELVSLHGFKGHDIGVIAQEIEAILPEVVTTRDSGYKAVKYEKIVPLLIQAIKEQQEQIKELQDIIKNK